MYYTYRYTWTVHCSHLPALFQLPKIPASFVWTRSPACRRSLANFGWTLCSAKSLDATPMNSWDSQIEAIEITSEIPNKGFLCTWQCALKKSDGLFGFKRCFEMKLCKLAKGLLGLFYAMMWQQKNMCTVTYGVLRWVSDSYVYDVRVYVYTSVHLHIHYSRVSTRSLMLISIPGLSEQR